MMCLIPKRHRVETYCPKMLTLVSKSGGLGATPASRFGSRERGDAVVLVQEAQPKRTRLYKRPAISFGLALVNFVVKMMTSSNPAILDRGVHLTGPVSTGYESYRVPGTVHTEELSRPNCRSLVTSV